MYNYNAKSKRHRKRTLIFFFVVVAAATGYFLTHRHSGDQLNNGDSQGKVTQIDQPGDNTKLVVNEPTFTMTLQGPWKEVSRNKDPRYYSIEWQYVKKFYEARRMTVYVDKLPLSTAVNYLLPVTVVDNTIQAGQLSENCTTFTKDAKPIEKRNPNSPEAVESLPAVWQKVNFYCDNGNVTRQVIGVSTADAINTIPVTGAHGKHLYFFVFNDQNFQLDSSFLVNALESFRAK